jgi:hypothetical protein
MKREMEIALGKMPLFFFVESKKVHLLNFAISHAKCHLEPMILIYLTLSTLDVLCTIVIVTFKSCFV